MDSIFARIAKNSDAVLAMGIVMILGVMVIPLPAMMLDLLLSFGIALSMMLLLTAVYSAKALDFNVFPSLLLVTTLFRLSLNVATTRRILLYGAEEGSEAAGDVIKSFGEFVVGGNYAVGLIIFIILVIINFIVITKGAGRVAEVAARFTLDAMPGKQMAIDADLNAGLINEHEARTRRSDIAREADFYGAMDGASKFVRGDAIAGIMIVVVNIIGGIIIGTLQKGMDVARAAEVFTLLTVGDGLVTQIPALIISTAAGIIVTRTASGTNFSSEFSKQLFMQPKAMWGACGILGFMAIIPGLPTIPFLIMSTALGGGAYGIERRRKTDVEDKRLAAEKEKLRPSHDKLEQLLPVDLLELEVGYGLIQIVDADQNGDLLERVSNIRKQFALDLGVIIPPLRIRDNLELKPGDYQILLKGIPIASGALMVGQLLAIDPGSVFEKIQGIPTFEPAFGLDALWITQNQKDEAVAAGYTVVDLSTVIATHLTEVIRSHSHELLGRGELQGLLESFKTISPKTVDELIPAILPVGTVLKVLKNLLKEGVSIRDMRTILEALAEIGAQQKDPIALTEHVRAGLGRNITKKLISPDGALHLMTLDKEIEESIASSIIQTDQGPQLSADPEFVRKLVAALNQKAIEAAGQATQPIVLCSPLIRAHLKGLIDRFIPNITVLSHNEIHSNISVKSLGTVRLAYAS